MISTQSFSGDAITLKISSVHSDWAMMFASSELGHVGPIYGAVQRELGDTSQKATGRRVREVVLAKYAQAHRRKADSILAPLELDLDSFKKEGRQILGQEIFAQYWATLNELSLNSSFLVAGYDEETRIPSIFEVSKLGEAVSHDPVGFWAIGTGASNALAILFFHSFNKFVGRERAIYHICEAKFMAESAAGVGKDTLLVEMRASGDEIRKIDKYELSPEFVSEIRQWWEIQGKPKFPEPAKDLIAAGLGNPLKLKRIIF
jgi:20S proteasome alpha/beta subunit